MDPEDAKNDMRTAGAEPLEKYPDALKKWKSCASGVVVRFSRSEQRFNKVKVRVVIVAKKPFSILLKQPN